MKRILFIFFLMCCFLNVFSQDYYLIVNMKNGINKSIAIKDINKITINELSSNIENKDILNNTSKIFQLFQNYPNPFNPITTIEYSIPTAGQVEINIFNINGQSVKKYINNYKTSGTYRIIWDGKDSSGLKVSSGIYIYQVIFNNTTFTKRMIFVK